MTEPSRFVVLGDGFVTEVLDSPTTFIGDFGTAILNEVEGHNTRTNPTNLELGSWTTQRQPGHRDILLGDDRRSSRT